MTALAAQQQATGLFARASALKDMAMKALNPAERQKMMQEAYDKELEANGKSKWASRLTSGPWQGGMGGAGIGGGVGMGLGTVVGTVVGGVVSLPTTALGGLVGAGVGGITGPFVKLDQKKAKEVEARERAKGKSDEEVAEAVKKEAVTEDPSGEADADAGEGASDEPAQSSGHGAEFSQPEQGSAKRNLERQHSGGGVPTQQQDAASETPTKARKKPKKIEVRSGKKAKSDA
ncbi:hypothetical protein BAUCODRAFT_542272 [Baudoinia panamericana UAMH 10762]|uniref:Glycine zipper domain-containing protein n=1 Tax=Baudoinia panamericana (strain UAMH 10762) TaxID=717646 RepID=M2MV50_BAUPA|nr:uncharacterized protein BAUCODRAFT_542272 [Baudoinia panamericana UAMH 10762]EMC95458.1 hypothetical protein BAUCODRAFT_542272 [Baudoinia panamericana UAMH 10762]